MVIDLRTIAAVLPRAAHIDHAGGEDELPHLFFEAENRDAKSASRPKGVGEPGK